MATKKLQKTSRKSKPKPYVLVRTQSAGVHIGILESRSGQEVVLSDTRRIWSWKGANSLSEIALRGVAPGSRISEAVASNTLLQAIEIIPCTEEARVNLDLWRWQ